jgi:hypothetical protein
MKPFLINEFHDVLMCNLCRSPWMVMQLSRLLPFQILFVVCMEVADTINTHSLGYEPPQAVFAALILPCVSDLRQLRTVSCDGAAIRCFANRRS